METYALNKLQALLQTYLHLLVWLEKMDSLSYFPSWKKWQNIRGIVVTACMFISTFATKRFVKTRVFGFCVLFTSFYPSIICRSQFWVTPALF
jgi:hypothetical protein